MATLSPVPNPPNNTALLAEHPQQATEPFKRWWLAVQARLNRLGAANLPTSTSYANDAAAAAGGVAIGEFYRNGSVVQCRIT